MNIRSVDVVDAEAICAIYNVYVRDSIVTFEEQAVSVDAMRSRITSATLPWVVLEDKGQIIGYSYAQPWRERSAYRHSVETSVYLDSQHTGRGLGRILLVRLLEMLPEKNIRTVMAGIALPNDASVALHQRQGFAKVAHFKEVGWKHDQWIDVAYWQYHLPLQGLAVEIRDYQSQDAKVLTDIFYDTVHQRATSLYSSAEVNAWAPLPKEYDYWAQRLDNLPPYVAWIDGRIVGFTTLTDGGHIEWTYTHKDFLGRGVGRALFLHLQEQARVKGLTVLTVDASRFARPMFEKFGFKVVTRNEVLRHGQTLENWSMTMNLD